MEGLRVHGGKTLAGSVRIPGAKNSVLPILAATLLCREPVELLEVPALSDVAASAHILQSLGSTVRVGPGRLRVTTGRQPGSEVPEALMRAMRSSLFYLAPLVSRTGRAVICRPGGCNLGQRPIDLHLQGLAAMGATVRQCGEWLEIAAPDGLSGAEIALRFPSVGATETLLMAAVCAKGQTVLRGAACEPEVADLAHFLQAAGACITGVGTRCLRITGRQELGGARWSVCPDRITAATVLFAAAGCGGSAAVTHVEPRDLAAVLRVLRRMGCYVEEREAAVFLAAPARLQGLGSLLTDVHPAFPTDAAPLAAAAALRAVGSTALTDTVFENRFSCAAGFAAMGGQAEAQGRMLFVQGVPALQGACVTAPDLRGGAALVLAALQAEGESIITGVGHIARGYEDIAALLAPLGAEINHVVRREAAVRT